MTYYKVLNPDGSCFHGGSGEWHLPRGSRPGKWMPKVATLEPCWSGYHVCRLDQLPRWLGPAVFEVEVRGPMVDHGDKLVVGEARLVRRCSTWDDRVARLFAADCAERALRRERRCGREPDSRSWAAVRAARTFANGTISDEDLAASRAAAWEAASAAAWEAAWEASSAAAWEAAWAASWAAAWEAARAAAREAARAASWAAAWAAETRWQAKRLGEYLDGTRP